MLERIKVALKQKVVDYLLVPLFLYVHLTISFCALLPSNTQFFVGSGMLRGVLILSAHLLYVNTLNYINPSL